MARQIHYSPPDPEKLDRLARDVCRQMGLDSQRGIAYDLAGFMRVLARACAKELNRKNGDLLDNDRKTT